MQIVIGGAGEVGRHAAEVLGADGHDITIIDQSDDRLEQVEATMDVRVLHGDTTHTETLRDAGVAGADLMLAATNDDRTNLLAASIASAMGAVRTVARVHHRAYFEAPDLPLDRHLGIDYLVCPEYATAGAIAQTLRNPGALAVERFARGRIELQRFPVAKDAPAAGKALGEVRIPARLVAVERGEDAFIPEYGATIQAGDVITMVGDARTFDKARALFQPKRGARRRIMILGGSAMAVWLCRALRSGAFSIRLIVEDRARAEELAGKLEWVTVLRHDSLDLDELEEERIDQVDSFVTLTDDDEQNILAAARAKTMGAQQAITVVQRSTYLRLLEHIGIDRAFSLRQTAVTSIRHWLAGGSMQVLASLAGGAAEVFEVRVRPSQKELVGRPLRDLKAKLPHPSIIAAIQRGDEAHVPGADDTLEPGDRAIVVGPAKIHGALKRLFTE